MGESYFIEGSKEEVMKFQRILDFGKDEITEGQYQVLIPEYKSCVYNVLRNLTGGKDFFGYNLSNFIRQYKNTEPSVAQLKISEALEIGARNYLPEGFYTVFSEQSKGKLGINKQLDFLKKTASMKEGTETSYFVREICDYFFTDIEVLEKGIGKTYWFKDGWYQRYSNDEKFLRLMEKEHVLNPRKRVECYEAYLAQSGQLEEGESVLEETWTVQKYSGLYLMLEQQKGKANELKAVKQLIAELYAFQIFDGKMNFPRYYEE